MYYVYVYPSFIGDLCLVADERNLLSLFFEDGLVVDDDNAFEKSEIIADTVCQLNDYFSGRSKTFNLRFLKDYGKSFHGLVLKELESIPYGDVMTYGEIALRLNNPKATRAVGTACKNNPYAIIIPCHRVISVARGACSGYAGGLDKKIELLKFERNVSGKVL